jgi:hypothetical protein
MEYEVGSEDEMQMPGGWIQHPSTSDADGDSADYQEEGEDSQVGTVHPRVHYRKPDLSDSQCVSSHLHCLVEQEDMLALFRKAQQAAASNQQERLGEMI